MTEYYPPVAFHFKVEFLGIGTQDIDTKFQSVSGLHVELETEEIKEGGENRFKHHLPLGAKYNNIVLNRGLAIDSGLIDWCMDAFENFNFQPADLLIKLLNENHEPLKTWSINHAIPVKWSVSDFNAEENAIAIESLELKIHYFTQLK